MTFRNARRSISEDDNFEPDYVVEYLNLDDQDEIIEEILQNLDLKLCTADVVDYITHREKNEQLDKVDNDIKRIFLNILQHATLSKKDVDCLEKEHKFTIYKINDVNINRINKNINRTGEGTIVFEI